MANHQDWVTQEYLNWLADTSRQGSASVSGADQEASSLIVANPALTNLHLSYSFGLENGPIILRRGDTSPVMQDPGKPGSSTSDPELQRIGAYFISGEKKVECLRKMILKFAVNYVRYGGFAGIQASRDDAQEIVESYSATDSSLNSPRIEPPPQFRPGGLLSDAATPAFQLEHVIPELAKSAHEAYQQWRDQNCFVDEAHAAMEELYKDTHPDYSALAPHDPPGLKSATRFNLRKYLRLLLLLSRTDSHDQVAGLKNVGDVVLMQGCGDLTMNEWNVAFVAGESYNGQHDRQWDLLHAPIEPLSDRRYSCLIRWSCEREDLDKLAQRVRVVYPYQIASLEFLAPSLEKGLPNRHVFLQGEPIGHLIEFAVYGRRVCRSGRAISRRRGPNVVPLQNIVREFSDLRHIFKLPNINPKKECSEAVDRNIPDYYKRPRNLFNQSTRDDVWLGEAALVQGDRNLRIAALSHAVQLNLRDLGAPMKWIELVLNQHEGYKQIHDGDIEKRGQWRWVKEGRETFLEIFFPASQYPCSIIGVNASDEGFGRQPVHGHVVDAESLYFFAHGHSYGLTGCTIEHCAELLRQKGVWDALLFDEGLDVFQLVFDPLNQTLKPRVPIRNREQLRCVFWVTA